MDEVEVSRVAPEQRRRMVLLCLSAFAAAACTLATISAPAPPTEPTELYVRSYQVGYSADLDAPTPRDISKEFWGYLDPDSPTPHELSDEALPPNADDVTKSMKYSLSSVMTTNPRGTAPSSALHQVIAAALGIAASATTSSSADAQGLGKYESGVMKSFLASDDAPTSASSPLQPSLPADGSALLSGSLEHTEQDVMAKEQRLKDIEVKREAQAMLIQGQERKQAGILKTQAWVKNAMRTEDDSMSSHIKKLTQVETGYDDQLQALWGQIKKLHKEETHEEEEKAKERASAAANNARLAAAWIVQRTATKAKEAAEEQQEAEERTLFTLHAAEDEVQKEKKEKSQKMEKEVMLQNEEIRQLAVEKMEDKEKNENSPSKVAIIAHQKAATAHKEEEKEAARAHKEEEEEVAIAHQKTAIAHKQQEEEAAKAHREKEEEAAIAQQKAAIAKKEEEKEATKAHKEEKEAATHKKEEEQARAQREVVTANKEQEVEKEKKEEMLHKEREEKKEEMLHKELHKEDATAHAKEQKETMAHKEAELPKKWSATEISAHKVAAALVHQETAVQAQGLQGLQGLKGLKGSLKGSHAWKASQAKDAAEFARAYREQEAQDKQHRRKEARAASGGRGGMIGVGEAKAVAAIERKAAEKREIIKIEEAAKIAIARIKAQMHDSSTLARAQKHLNDSFTHMEIAGTRAADTQKPVTQNPSHVHERPRMSVGYELDKFVKVGRQALPHTKHVKGHQVRIDENKKPPQSASPSVSEQLGLSSTNPKTKSTNPRSPSVIEQLGLSFAAKPNSKVLHMPGWLDSNVEQALGFQDKVVQGGQTL